MPATECRRVLQHISNIMFADSKDQPEVTKLPTLVQQLKDQSRRQGKLSTNETVRQQQVAPQIINEGSSTDRQHMSQMQTLEPLQMGG